MVSFMQRGAGLEPNTVTKALSSQAYLHDNVDKSISESLPVFARVGEGLPFATRAILFFVGFGSRSCPCFSGSWQVIK